MEIKFSQYRVKKEKDNFYAIYKQDQLLTHKPSWRQATKIAKLLQKAYKDGYEEAKWIYYDEYR